MSDPTDLLLEATTRAVPALLTALDGLAVVGRQLHPPRIAELSQALEPLCAPLEEGLAAFSGAPWPDHLHDFRDRVDHAGQEVLAACGELCAATREAQPAMAAYRALRHTPRALEALYPVAAMLPPVNRFFLNEAQRDDTALAERLLAGLETQATQPEDRLEGRLGILHVANDTGERGGFSLYVPESYQPGERWPLVVALHGGSGHGRGFLWSWLRDARSRGVLLLSPTSQDRTWSLMEPETDHGQLRRMVAFVQEHYSVDTERVLLTGMSDGGTFSWLSALAAPDPFCTHVAPVAASFHPMLLQGVEAERLARLPIYLVHGALDWMFPVQVAQEARDALTAAGAQVVYRELSDLSHTYPVEENAAMLSWLLEAGP